MHKRGNILVVDDEINLCRILDAKLTRSGYEVMTVHDGLQAVEKAKEQRFDLVLLDLILPKLGGLEALERIRKIRSDVPVIIMTACESSDALSRAMSQGICAFLSKPFDLERLVTLVQNTSAESHSVATGIHLGEESGIFRKGQPVTVETLNNGDAIIRCLLRSRGDSCLELMPEQGEGSVREGASVRVLIPAPEALFRFVSMVYKVRHDGFSVALPQVVSRVQRRRSPRVELQTGVALRCQNASECTRGNTWNVSAGGLSAVVADPLVAGRLVDIEARQVLHIDHFAASGTVLRCSMEERDGRLQWRLAVEFDRQNAVLRRAILSHLACRT